MDPKRSLITGQSPNLQEKKRPALMKKANIPDQPFTSTVCMVITTVCISQVSTFVSPLTNSNQVNPAFSLANWVGALYVTGRTASQLEGDVLIVPSYGFRSEVKDWTQRPRFLAL